MSLTGTETGTRTDPSNYDFYDLFFIFQYAFMLTTILVVESTILFFGYWFREEITKGFHAAMSNGLQWYGKEPSLSSVVDDIQSTVRNWKIQGITNDP